MLLERVFLADGTIECCDNRFIKRLLRRKIPFVRTVLGYDPPNRDDAEHFVPRDSGEDLVGSGVTVDIARLLYHGRIIPDKLHIPDELMPDVASRSLKQIETQLLLLQAKASKQLAETYGSGISYDDLCDLYGIFLLGRVPAAVLQWRHLNGCRHRKLVLRLDSPRPIFDAVSEVLIPDLARMVVDFLVVTQ